MFREIIEHLQTTFPDHFIDGRYRGLDQGFDLNGFRSSDLIIMPASTTNRKGDPITQQSDGAFTVRTELVGVFLFSKKIDVDKTVKNVASALVNTPGVEVTLRRAEVNPGNIMKELFKKNLTSDLCIFAIWFRVGKLITISKETCEICYVDC